jgi:hypothetical protein
LSQSSGPQGEFSISGGVGAGAGGRVQIPIVGEIELEAVIADQLRVTAGTGGFFAGEVLEARIGGEFQLGPFELKGGISIEEQTPFTQFGRDPTGLDRFLDRLGRLDFTPTGDFSTSAEINRKLGFKLKTFLGIGGSIEGSVSP